jgi:hypothetical protein
MDQKINNMEKEFVPYELALRLKVLGFDEPCFGLFENKKLGFSFCCGDEQITPIVYRCNSKFVKNILTEDCCTAPTFSQAFKWFREKYNLVFNFISYSIVKPGEYHWSITWNDEAKAVDIVKTYEEAELACLEKLIEIVEPKLN